MSDGGYEVSTGAVATGLSLRDLGPRDNWDPVATALGTDSIADGQVPIQTL